jgi:hypothetical protein
MKEKKDVLVDVANLHLIHKFNLVASVASKVVNCLQSPAPDPTRMWW